MISKTYDGKELLLNKRYNLYLYFPYSLLRLVKVIGKGKIKMNQIFYFFTTFFIMKNIINKVNNNNNNYYYYH